MDFRKGSHASTGSFDHRVAKIIARQSGVITRRQAIAAGASPSLIDHRVAGGRWELLHPGVYRILGAPSSWRQQLLAACLAAGAGAAASHRSAAALRQIIGGEALFEVSVPSGRRARLQNVLVHQSRGLDRVDLTVVDAIPCTTPTRTLIDLSSVLDPDVLEEALDDALRRRLTSVALVRRRLARLGTRGRVGAGTLANLLDERGGRATSESVPETRFLRLIRRAGLPLPESQFEIRDRGRLIARVDFAYPHDLLAIEVDSYRWHSGRHRWQHDLRRRNALTALGWRVIHVTSTDLDERPGDLATMIAGALPGTAELDDVHRR